APALRGLVTSMGSDPGLTPTYPRIGLRDERHVPPARDVEAIAERLESNTRIDEKIARNETDGASVVAPHVVLRRCAHVRARRVEVDVPHRFATVSITLDDHVSKPALEQVPAPTVTEVVRLRVAAVQTLETAAQRGSIDANEQVI